MLREAGCHLARRGEIGRAISAPPGLRLLECPSKAHRDQRVLELRPRGIVHVDIPSGNAGDPEATGQVRKPAVSRSIPSPERSLELDPEAIAPEGLDETTSERLRPARLPGR